MLRFSSPIIATLLLAVSMNGFGQSLDALLVPKQSDGKWGYCSLDEQWVIPPMYEDAFPFSTVHGEEPYTASGIREMVSGTESIAFRQPLALAVKDGRYGMINAKGEETVPFVSEGPFAFRALGGAFVGIIKTPVEELGDGMMYYTDMAIMHVNGTLLTPFRYDCVFNERPWYDLPPGLIAMRRDEPDFPDFMPNLNWLRVRQEGKIGYIDESGAYTIPLQYGYLSNFWKGTAVGCMYKPEEDRSQCWFIDTLNRQQDTLAGRAFGDFYDGCLKVSVPGEAYNLAMVNHRGAYIIPSIGQPLGYRKGLAISMQASADDTYDVYDTSGQVIFQFHGLDGFYAHKNTVLMKDRNGYWSRFAEGQVIPLNQQAEQVGRPLEFGGRYLFHARHQGKWGLWDESGHIYHPYVWDTPPQRLEGFDYPESEDFHLIVRQKGKQGLMDTAMQMLLPCEYDRISKGGGFFHVERDGKRGLINEDYELVIPPIYDEVRPYPIKRYPKMGYSIRDRGKYGYLDTAGQVLFPPLFSRPLNFDGLIRDGLMVAHEGKTSIVLKRDGVIKQDSSAHYDFHGIYSDYSLIKVKPHDQPDSYYLIDTSLQLFTPIGYRLRQHIPNCELAVLEAPNGHQGSIHLDTRDTLVPFQAHKLSYRPEGAYFLITRQDTLREVLFWKEGRRLRLENREVRDCSSGTITIGACPPDWENRCNLIGGFREGLADYCELSRFGFLDTALNVAIPAQYRKSQSFSEGLAAVSKDGKWGFIDRNGQEQIPFVYEDARSFHCGQAAVQKADKWGLIDAVGQAVADFQYKSVFPPQDGYWLLHRADRLNDVWGCNGALLLQAVRRFSPTKSKQRHRYWTKEGVYGEYPMPADGRYDDLPYAHQTKPLNDALWAARFDEDSWGVFDQAGDCVVPPAYQDIEYLEKAQLLKVRRNRSYGLLDLDGQQLLPADFDEIVPMDDAILEVWEGGEKAYFVIGTGLFE